MPKIDDGFTKIAAQHCAIEKTGCNGDRVVYELMVNPPKAADVRQLGGGMSNIYAIRDPDYASGADKRYTKYFGVCYPCDANGNDSLACDCVTEGVGKLNSAGDYAWRNKWDYNPRLMGSIPTIFTKFSADFFAGTLFTPNSNSFAKYFMYRCTKRGRRPERPPLAPGWGFDFGGKGPDFPPPWGGVVDALGERYE